MYHVNFTVHFSVLQTKAPFSEGAINVAQDNTSVIITIIEWTLFPTSLGVDSEKKEAEL